MDKKHAEDRESVEFRDEWGLISKRRLVAFVGQERSEKGDSTGSSNGQSNGQSNGDVTGNAPSRPKDLVGLALSGGGLRSAIFSDGFLQALSHRGLLRYVDYLCSVSGGGYIAGHLMTYSRPKPADANDSTGANDLESNASATAAKSSTVPELNFHENAAEWPFGRDPNNGIEDASRLTGVGQYLSRTFEFFAGYLLRQLPAFVLYLSFVGMFGTLLAIYFRSFDDPLFRSAFTQGYGVKFGNELFIAFLPTVIVATIYVTLAVAVWIADLFVDVNRFPWLSAVSRLLCWATLLSAMVSVAVFMGNDLTRATGDRDVANWTRLNGFAVQISIIAALVQILVFLGRDRLFRSEKSESSRWQKIAQSVIANGVVAFLIFAMVHVMASENISRYTYTRDAYLARGEVIDWKFLVGVFAQLEHDSRVETPAWLDTVLKQLDFDAWAARNLTGLSTAHKKAVHSLAGNEFSRPPTPAELDDSARDLPIGVVNRTTQLAWLCLLPKSLYAANASFDDSDIDARNFPSVQRTLAAAKYFQERQRRYLIGHNALLESAELTVLLLTRLAPNEQKGKSNKLAWNAAEVTPRIPLTVPFVFESELPKSSFSRIFAQKHVESRIESLSTSRRANLERRLNNHDLGTLPSFKPTQSSSSVEVWPTWHSAFEVVGSQAENVASASEAAAPSPGLIERVYLNRELLELCGEHEAVLKPMEVASTPVVQPHDQAARWRWFTCWTILFGVALVLTSKLNRLSHLFRFYHTAIDNYFLRGRKGYVQGRTRVADLQPWESGLPFPIYLAAWLKPSAHPSSGRVARAVSITPLQITLRDGIDANGRDINYSEPTADYQYEAGQHVKLTEAVAISGAAVTPNMTNNPALVILMDFFGARLGLWFRRPTSQPSPLVSEYRALIEIVGVAMVIVVAVLWSLYPTFANLGLLLVPLIAWWFVACVVAGRGYPALLVSLIRSSLCSSSVAPPLNFKAEGEERNAEVTKCWPNIFVSDGGFVDFLGVTELLRRRCELIIVSDAGVNTGSTTLESLAIMCERASSQLGVRFIDLDHDAPIEFARLQRNVDQHAPQPYLAMRVKYPPSEDSTLPREGILFYAQMAISERDPIEIQQIRHRFPSFPDEPTTNQFYTLEQVAAYRDLGYHIGNRLCSQLKRWSKQEIAHKDVALKICSNGGQPMFAEVKRRLVRGYLQACYEEFYYRADDVYGESIWRGHVRPDAGNYPTFVEAWSNCQMTFKKQSKPPKERSKLAFLWLDQFMMNADVSSRYLEAVNYDVNGMRTRRLGNERNKKSSTLAILEQLLSDADGPPDATLNPHVFAERLKSSKEIWAAHLVAVAAAAQQLHRGTPHSIFQVGGREKLCSVISHLVQDLVSEMYCQEAKADGVTIAEDSAREASDPNSQSQLHLDYAEAIVHEVCELTDSVFQSADYLAVVSFVQCLCNELVPVIRFDRRALPIEAGNEPMANGAVSTEMNFQLSLDFRQLMLDVLQTGYRSRSNQLIEAYLKYLDLETEASNRFVSSDRISLARYLSSEKRGISTD